MAAAGKDAEVAIALGVKPHAARDWRLRDSIPSERWNDVVAAGFATLNELADAAAKRPSSRDTETQGRAA